MASNKLFYSISDYWSLVPGLTLHIQRTIHYAADKAENAIRPLVFQEKKELEAQKAASAKKEADIKKSVEKLMKDWEQQAGQTLLLVRAIEYLDTEEVKHTGNQWKQDKEGTWVISNRVYKMKFKISDVPGKNEVNLRWSLEYNWPKQPASKRYEYNRYNNPWGASIYIVKPENRKYTTVSAAQKFIQARYDENYALFSELSPPVPLERREMFSVNGFLLPGYTVAPPERAGPDLKSVESLLDFLDEDDTAPPPQAAPVDPGPQSPAKPQKLTAPPIAGRPKRPPAKPKPKRKSSMSR